MNEFAHGAMLVGALTGAGCAVTTRRAALDLAASAVMLLAMCDMALTRLAPPLAWTMALVGIGLALGVRLRTGRAARGTRILPPEHLRLLHRALTFIVGGWAFALPAAAGAAASTHAHGSGGVAFALAALTMTVFGGCLVARELRADDARRLRHAAEAASTSLMLAAMAVPGVVAALA
ncbi:hypothetical protein ACFVTX_09335 [Agromyces sp. NPDC058136]|uniref:hypothetical protein n=1 Tax=Agromyces sp. NPDC058136 TaxID=3346354 RepID=UPI0036D93CC6